MKKLLFTLSIVFMTISCAATKNRSGVAGDYYGKTPRIGSFVPPGEMALLLSNDASFQLSWLQITYTGKWEALGRKHILLKFDTITDPAILLRSGTFSGEDKRIEIIGKRKIKLDGFVLKRK